MNEINFLQRDERSSKQAEKVKSVVVPVTTAVLVVYLVIISGLFGWWWWWSGKQSRVSAEYSSLLSQVNSKLNEEILVKRLIDRVTVINAYLDERTDVYKQTEFLKDYQVDVVGYSVVDDGYFSITLNASESAQVRSIVPELKERFNDVMLKSISWDMEKSIWTTTYWYKGEKHE